MNIVVLSKVGKQFKAEVKRQVCTLSKVGGMPITQQIIIDTKYKLALGSVKNSIRSRNNYTNKVIKFTMTPSELISSNTCLEGRRIQEAKKSAPCKRGERRIARRGPDREDDSASPIRSATGGANFHHGSEGKCRISQKSGNWAGKG